MKIAFVTLVATLSVAMAAPAMPPGGRNEIKCEIDAPDKPSLVKVTACCKQNMGKHRFDRDGKNVELECRLPWGKLVGFKKCVNDLKFPAILECERD
ncbi:hypothetical protein BGZ72_008674 [Mortierella alpina]|nr:hypothetical protein BGZ72_008674 [Mortierella alpina]